MKMLGPAMLMELIAMALLAWFELAEKWWGRGRAGGGGGRYRLLFSSP
jgi:hypothetical protein